MEARLGPPAAPPPPLPHPHLPGHHDSEAASYSHSAEQYQSPDLPADIFQDFFPLPTPPRHLDTAHSSNLNNKKNVHVVGDSSGANIALHFASHFPDLVAVSVFVTGTAGFIASKLAPYVLWVLGGIVTHGRTRAGVRRHRDGRRVALPRTVRGAISGMLQIPVDDERLIAGELLRRGGVRALVTAAATKK